MGDRLTRLAFWWFGLFDYPIDPKEWRWHHHFTFLLGSIPAAIGFAIIGYQSERAHKKKNELQKDD